MGSVRSGVWRKARRAQGSIELPSFVAVGLIALAVLAIVALVAVNTTPLADDYVRLRWISEETPWRFFHFFWVSVTDRYSNALLMLVTVKVLGPTALQVTPILLVALLCFFCAVCVKNVRAAGEGTLRTSLVGVVAGVGIATSGPSVFDSLGWFNAVTIYLAGLVAAAATAAWASHVVITQARTIWPIVVSFVIAFFASGFSEIVGAIIALAALLAAVNAVDTVPLGPRRRGLLLNLSALAIGGLAGVAVIFFGPGSRGRAHRQAADLAISRLLAGIKDNTIWVHYFLGWRALGGIAVGLLCLCVLPRAKAPQTIRWLIVWAAFLLVVPLVVMAAMIGYASPPPAVAPWRTAFVATAFMTIGTGVLTYAAGALLTSRTRRPTLVAPAAAVAFFVIAVGFTASALPVIRAERLRATADAARARSIRLQLRGHARVVSVTPVPLIDRDTNAYDLFFNHLQQVRFVEPVLRIYFGIPASTRLRVIATQPHTYCLPNVAIPWFGVKACAALAHSQAG